MNGIWWLNKHDEHEIISIVSNAVKKTNRTTVSSVSAFVSSDRFSLKGFFFQGHGEARDEMSLLTREAAVRILAYLDVADLARCAQVDRTCDLRDI